MPARCLTHPDRGVSVKGCRCARCERERERNRNRMREKYRSDPEYRARDLAHKRNPKYLEQQRAYARARQRDPEFRERKREYDQNRRSDPQVRERRRQQRRERYARLKDRGWCVQCAKDVAVSSTLCQDCLNRQSERFHNLSGYEYNRKLLLNRRRQALRRMAERDQLPDPTAEQIAAWEQIKARHQTRRPDGEISP